MLYSHKNVIELIFGCFFQIKANEFNYNSGGSVESFYAFCGSLQEILYSVQSNGNYENTRKGFVFNHTENFFKPSQV